MNSNLRIIKSENENGYSIIKRNCPEDKTLSWKAKGIYLYLATRPPGWEINNHDLIKRSTDGETSLRSGLKELINAKYIYRMVTSNEKKQITQWTYLVFDRPIISKEDIKKHVIDANPGLEFFRKNKNQDDDLLPEKAINGKTNNGFPGGLNNNKINNNKTKNKEMYSLENNITSLTFSNIFSKESIAAGSGDDHLGNDVLSGGDQTPSEITPNNHSRKSKFNRPPVKQPTASAPASIPEDQVPPPAATGSLTAEQIDEGLAKTFRARAESLRPRKKKPLKTIPNGADEIIETWTGFGFKMPDPERAPSTYNNTIRKIKKAMKGRLLPNDPGRVFSVDQIKEAISVFHTIVTDPNYGPSREMKEVLAKKNLGEFLYSRYGKTESWLLRCVDEPLRSNENRDLVEDKHPNVTNKIIGFYQSYVFGGGIKKRLTPRETNKFREASNKICELYDKRSNVFGGVTGGYSEMADILCSAIKNCYKNDATKVRPGSFCSSFAISQMVAYMKTKGYLVLEDTG